MKEYIKQVEKYPVVETEHILMEDGQFLSYTSRSIIRLAEQFPSLSIVNIGSFDGAFADYIIIEICDISKLNLRIESKIDFVNTWKDEYCPQEIPIEIVANLLKQTDVEYSTFAFRDENNNYINWSIMYHPNVEIVGPELEVE